MNLDAEWDREVEEISAANKLAVARQLAARDFLRTVDGSSALTQRTMRDIAVDVFGRFGLRFEVVGDRVHTHYENGTVFMPPADHRYTTVVHEAAHWIEAGPDGRKLPNYGIHPSWMVAPAALFWAHVREFRVFEIQKTLHRMLLEMAKFEHGQEEKG